MRVYEVKIGGVDHTMQLTEQDAQRYGAVEHKRAAPKAAVRTPRRRAVKSDADDD